MNGRRDHNHKQLPTRDIYDSWPSQSKRLGVCDATSSTISLLHDADQVWGYHSRGDGPAWGAAAGFLQYSKRDLLVLVRPYVLLSTHLGASSLLKGQLIGSPSRGGSRGSGGSRGGEHTDSVRLRFRGAE